MTTLPLKVPLTLTVNVEYVDHTTEQFECAVHGDGVEVREDITHDWKQGHLITTTRHQVSWETVKYETDPRSRGWILNGVKL